jgi:hypothetical protein
LTYFDILLIQKIFLDFFNQELKIVFWIFDFLR